MKILLASDDYLREKNLRHEANLKGGAGSGNFDHEGRPGQQGGSASDGLPEAPFSETKIPRKKYQKPDGKSSFVLDRTSPEWAKYSPTSLDVVKFTTPDGPQVWQYHNDSEAWENMKRGGGTCYETSPVKVLEYIERSYGPSGIVAFVSAKSEKNDF